MVEKGEFRGYLRTGYIIFGGTISWVFLQKILFEMNNLHQHSVRDTLYRTSFFSLAIFLQDIPYIFLFTVVKISKTVFYSFFSCIEGSLEGKDCLISIFLNEPIRNVFLKER